MRYVIYGQYEAPQACFKLSLFMKSLEYIRHSLPLTSNETYTGDFSGAIYDTEVSTLYAGW